MPSFDRAFSCASPTIVLPSPQSFGHNLNMTSTHPSFPSGYAFAQTPQVNGNGCSPLQQTPNSRAGRKRSRDEAAIEDASDYFQPAPEPENEEEWVYGPGMTLIRPNGHFIEAGSQTGTWAEEKAEEEKAKSRPHTPNDKPILRSHKSQRLTTATPGTAEEVVFANGASSNIPSSPPKAAMAEPTVDDFTIHLGIGWSRISDDEHIQAAARGWAKFIENHFPVSNANIRLQSKGLASYLVEAAEGYFLFGEDLKQGRLVSTSLENTFRNLQSRPPLFDGLLTMEASVTPKPDETTSCYSHFGSAVNGSAKNAPLVGAHSVEVEMDMS